MNHSSRTKTLAKDRMKYYRCKGLNVSGPYKLKNGRWGFSSTR